MIILRKGKKTILEGASAFEIAENINTVEPFASLDEEVLNNIKWGIHRNAFGLCIKGASLRLGNGFIVECK